LDAHYNTNHQLRIETSKNWDIKTFQDEGFINQSLLFKNTLLTEKNQQGWFRVRRIKNLSPAPDYRLLKLYYQAKDSCQVTVKQGRQTIYTGYLLPKDKVSTLDVQFNRTPDDIRFDFNSKDTLNISGLSLESGTGVLVDNIALRGLSYPTFSTSDQKKIGEMLDEVTIGLFVLHFGVNVVPYLSGNYRHFKNNFQRQLSFLKEIRPEVPILVIGVSDMAEKQGASFVSYANIPAIKAVQREIAMENHVAFWDLQQFMGGQGGMVNWADAKPALARKDYTHFSEQGANAVGDELARMIFNALNPDSITAQ
jgi:lysophospholipase L1-like esterase